MRRTGAGAVPVQCVSDNRYTDEAGWAGAPSACCEIQRGPPILHLVAILARLTQRLEHCAVSISGRGVHLEWYAKLYPPRAFRRV